MSESSIILSALPKTWLIDIDGTIAKHNGHLHGEDKLLKGVLEFFAKIPASDKIIFLTSRNQSYENQTISFMQKNNIRYDKIIFDLPFGERILINDNKPSGLKTAHAINKERDGDLVVNFIIDENL